MITELELPDSKFFDKKLTGLNLKNFIFGKNATGKSSITEEIENQYSNDYDIRIFQGYDRVISKGGLTTIALGAENTELQPKIDQQKNIIKKLIEDIEEPEFGLKAKYDNSISNYNKLETEINNFCSLKASEIKNEHVSWTGPNYNINSFKKDIKCQVLLTDVETEKNKKVIKETVLNNPVSAFFNEPELHNYLEGVNDIISEKVTKTVLLKFDSNNQENWVKEGLKYNAEGYTCSFCGSKITSRRWNDLNSYFNDEVKKLDKRINAAKEKITCKIKEIENIRLIDKSCFYSEFHSEVDKLNIKISKLKSDYNSFLSVLLSSINEKQKNIFIPLSSIEQSYPDGYTELNNLYATLLEKNKKYGKSIESKQHEAMDKLRRNEVAKEINSFNYFKKIGQLHELEKIVAQSEYNLKNKKSELSKENEKLTQLNEKTKDESIAAKKINEQLRALGNQSFTLEKDTDDNTQGKYWIRGYDGNPRENSTLSTGEKNIVAFLWFINDLSNPKKKSNKEMVIVFDDPMNSNDDTVQYLIVTELQKLLKETDNKLNKRQIFILTHNVHFYSNVRYNKWWNRNGKQPGTKKTYHLEKCGQKSNIKSIEDEKDDIKTSYEELWEEVHFLYKHGRADFMLNPLRRILETYKNFNKIEDMYLENKEAKKLFDVNSHYIDDFETDLNGKDADAIMNIVESLFKQLNATEHFDNFWKNRLTN